MRKYYKYCKPEYQGFLISLTANTMTIVGARNGYCNGGHLNVDSEKATGLGVLQFTQGKSPCLLLEHRSISAGQ